MRRRVNPHSLDWSGFSYTDLAASEFHTLLRRAQMSCHRAGSVSTSSAAELADLHSRDVMIWRCYKKVWQNEKSMRRLTIWS